MAKKKRKVEPKTLKGKIKSFARAPALNRKVLRQGSRPTLDLRRKPGREIPVKQHGFKEEEIGHGNLL